MSACVVCNKKFREGDLMQAFLACPEDPNGSWALIVTVDADYQNRASDKIKRKHKDCDASFLGNPNKPE